MLRFYHFIPFFGLCFAFIQGIEVTKHTAWFIYQVACTAIVAGLVVPAVIHEIATEIK